MSLSSFTTPTAQPPGRHETDLHGGSRVGVTEAGNLLREAFGGEFQIVDGASGEIVALNPLAPRFDFDRFGLLCKAVAEHGRPEFLADEEPLYMLAVPVTGERDLVGIGCFLSHPPRTGELAAVAERLGGDAQEWKEWAARQSPQTPETLFRLALNFVGRQSAERALRRSRREVDEVSDQLLRVYEEINLIHRLTRNLRLSQRDEDLALIALEWLVDVIPAAGYAVHFSPYTTMAADGADIEQPARFLTHRECPVTPDEFVGLLDRAIEAHSAGRPLVFNRSTHPNDFADTPHVRQLIVAPIADADRVFGWIAVFNSATEHDFGTVEAGLLNSVAGILGIHGGNNLLYRQQAELMTGVVRALTSAIDAKDPYTCGHSDRVARVAVRLGEELGCDEKTLDTLYLGGLLHDVGKIGVDDHILRKPGKLTPAEFEHIKTHTTIGYNILRDLKRLGQVLPIVLHHHESWDGKGYPHGLAGERIPWLARILAVADAFDAMGSDRPYRKGMEEVKLDEIIRAGAGQQWDAEVVAAFFRARDDVRRIAGHQAEATAADVDHLT